jgi:hypothetical protein
MFRARGGTDEADSPVVPNQALAHLCAFLLRGIMVPFQTFISYARRDDQPFPPESHEANGFVTALVRNLKYDFQSLGGTAPELWRDTRAIKASDQFDPIIQKAITNSDLLLVILSRNWLERDFCLRELNLFAKRWQHEGEESLKSRIIVVAKHHVANEDRPPLLQGQDGYRFYRRDDDEAIGREQEFFRRGRPQDDEYHDRVEAAAYDLWARSRMHGATSYPPEIDLPKRSNEDATIRTIYLAKSAADMRPAYLRLVDELQQRRYRVVPDPATEIPYDDTAAEFVDSALRESEISIHLLGEKSGYAPDDADPIVKLQLVRAAQRVAAPIGEPSSTDAGFRRIVWAPRILVDREAETEPGIERDPLAVLERFDKQRATDKIEGAEIGKFVDFVLQYLTRTTKPPKQPPKIVANAQVYVDHGVEDTDYAFEFGKALRGRKIQPVFPNFEGNPTEVAAANRGLLRECDAVVVCWANAAEVWARSRFPEFQAWHDLGRERGFACRGLIAGPPAGKRKRVFIEFPPRNELDVVLDLTGYEWPVPEALDPLIKATQAGEDPTNVRS